MDKEKRLEALAVNVLAGLRGMRQEEDVGFMESSREIPWTAEPGGLQIMGLQRVRHGLATKEQHSP